MPLDADEIVMRVLAVVLVVALHVLSPGAGDEHCDRTERDEHLPLTTGRRVT